MIYIKRKYKGSVLLPFIIGAVVAVVVIAAVIILAGGGFGFGGGTGDGEGSGNTSQAVEVMENITSSEITTEQIEYINISISGSDYLYNNQKFTLDELIQNITDGEKITVKITDDGASVKAYDALIESLKENNIRYIEQGGL